KLYTKALFRKSLCHFFPVMPDLKEFGRSPCNISKFSFLVIRALKALKDERKEAVVRRYDSRQFQTGLGLEVDDDDELVEEHGGAVSHRGFLEGFTRIETLKQELSRGGRIGNQGEGMVPVKDLKDVFFCWSKLSKLAEDYHPDVGSVEKAISVFNDNVMNYFWKVQKS
ncbi:putative Tigger transposable element-derived protein 1-like 284, partial [Homarus americanus]